MLLLICSWILLSTCLRLESVLVNRAVSFWVASLDQVSYSNLLNTDCALSKFLDD
jgi:glutamyl-tRNA reductase